ncbi:cytidylyltransferase domain-containing protein [Pontibacter locisalis]|uniref:Cytidylyltransferase domain-containing protein n=1 Tax=Pontibacter locisalis TaxID=1719035 RepID=A0ABW5IL21_9BACT
MRSLLTVCARGGSKGIPGKNIKPLNNKPLIYYTLKTAVAYASLRDDVDIYLSTDSDEIRSEVDKFSFDSVKTDYDRPKELATDSSGKLGVIKDVLEFAENKTGKKYDYIIDLDVTSPLRTVDDLQLAFRKLKDSDAINIFSVNPASRNPYFNMVEHRENSIYVKLVKDGEFLTRQSSPEVYDMNASFYIWKREFFEIDQKNNITDKTIIYSMPHLCFDLDHPLDFEFMSFLIETNKLDFTLLK